MEYQDQQSFPLIQIQPTYKIHRKSLPSGSAGGEKHGFRPKSASWKPSSSAYTYNPIETSNTPDYSDEYPKYQTPPPPNAPPPTQSLANRRGLFSGGWRSGCTSCAMMTAFVFFINVSLTVWAYSKHGGEGGIGTVYEGNCDLTKKLSLGAHMFINALGTILLSASNYTMQCLSAPTRTEVDKAHKEFKWLDIGVPSVKNLFKIKLGRLFLWFLIGISSVPLHFIYNSAVFSTTSTYDYYSTAMPEKNMTISDTTGYERLENKACMQTYGRQFISDRRDVILVVSGINETQYQGSHGVSLANGASAGEPFDWICESFPDFPQNTYPPAPCKISKYIDRADSWKIGNGTVQYCLSELMDERCSLQYSLHIMIAVIICNAVKSICMFLTVFKSNHDPLVTVGDAIASFLKTPDKTTVGLCIASKSDISEGAWKPINTGTTHLWKPHKSPWFRAASVSRWVICNLLASVGISIVGWLLSQSNIYMDDSGIQRDISFLWELGIGAIDVRLMMPPIFYSYSEGYKSLIGCILTANLAQAIFSFLYLLYNSIFTCMLLADEWDRFSHRRRPLRVTSPVGSQRSTHFLQLPYKYSLPLIITSGFMHWLISQCIFLARVSVISHPRLYNGVEYDNYTDTISMVGWSPIAIILALILSILILVSAIANGFRKYGGGIPLVGQCSAAISAACHPDPTEFSPETQPVMWGVTNSNGEVGHCSFSSEEVEAPVPDQKYAGWASGRGHINIDDGAIKSLGQRWGWRSFVS